MFKYLFINTFILFIIISCKTDPKLEYCEYYMFVECPGITRNMRRSSSASLPTQTSASYTNPAAVPTDKGVGIESIYLKGFDFGLVSGTGRVGAVVSNSTAENSFFGNYAFEDYNDHYIRETDKDKYKPNKLAISTGAKIVERKYKGYPVALNLGLIAKRHNEIKKINLGGGATVTAGPIYFAYSKYYDDNYYERLNYYIQDENNRTLASIDKSNFSEKYEVSSFSIGLKYVAFAADYGIITTKFPDSPYTKLSIHIINGTLFLKNIMLTYGLRNEKHNRRMLTTTSTNVGMADHNENFNFMAFQYSFSKKFILGLLYNYYLLRDISIVATLFF